MRIRWLILVLLAAGAVWASSSGRIARLTLAFQILDELRRPGAQSWLRRATPAPSRSALTLEGAQLKLAADLYRPERGAGRVPVILVPGLVEAGKDDPRVPPFAELLARAGFPVVVPNLPSFRTLRAHPDNVRDLAAALDAVTARSDLAPQGRAGLFGISYAGSIALLVALDPACAARVPFPGRRRRVRRPRHRVVLPRHRTHVPSRPPAHGEAGALWAAGVPAHLPGVPRRPAGQPGARGDGGAAPPRRERAARRSRGLVEPAGAPDLRPVRDRPAR